MTGNEPANPTMEQRNQFPDYWTTIEGETLLHKWSAMAMQGILANHWCRDDFNGQTAAVSFDLVAKQSVQYAKALITELNKQT